MKDKSICKAVIGMDGKQSEVGVSNGRSGKSLLGEACRVVVNTLYKNGKEFRGGPLQPFVWDGLDNRTRLVFLDDTPKDFDFEGFSRSSPETGRSTPRGTVLSQLLGLIPRKSTRPRITPIPATGTAMRTGSGS